MKIKAVVLYRVFMFCFVSFLTLVSCKSKAVIVDSKKEATRLPDNKIITNYYNNKSDFSTLYIKSNVRYATEKQVQNVSAEIKIKKDEQILVSIRLLGFPVAKALITPTTVSYYEKINRSYFEGDFSSLSKWLGTDLDFKKIQDMLMGRAMDDLKKGNYQESIEDEMYKLIDVSDTNTKKAFFFDKKTFLVKKQEIAQIAEERKIQAVYSDHKVFNDVSLPLDVLINAMQLKGKTEINLNYNDITFNEEISFPYSVPSGYKRILIK